MGRFRLDIETIQTLLSEIEGDPSKARLYEDLSNDLDELLLESIDSNQ